MFHHAYLHGFASSSLSRKGQALRRFYAGHELEFRTPDLNVPSFAALTYSAMLGALDALDRGVDPEGRGRWRFVASSMGGFVAARWAELHPERVDRLLLLCPAFDPVQRWPSILGTTSFERWREQGSITLPDGAGEPTEVHWGLVEDAMRHPGRPVAPCPTTIIHGTGDTIVPIESSRAYAAAHDQVRLIEVDDDHLLASSLPTIEATALAELIQATLYWDFFGPPAAGTAEHFHRHLDEFLAREGLAGCETGVELYEPGRHAAAWCRCPAKLVAVLGRALKPRRIG